MARKWVTVGALGAGTNSFTDTSVGANKLYYYSVRAYNTWGVSPSSPVVHVRTPKVVVIRKARQEEQIASQSTEGRTSRAAFGPSVRRQGLDRASSTAVDTVLMSWQHPLLKRSIVG